MTFFYRFGSLPFEIMLQRVFVTFYRRQRSMGYRTVFLLFFFIRDTAYVSLVVRMRFDEI